MADSKLESVTIVSSSYQPKARENAAIQTSSSIEVSVCGSSHLSSSSRITDGVATGNVPLSANQADITTKKTADSDNRKKSKMAEDARSNPGSCEAIVSTNGYETKEVSIKEHFDDQRHSLKTATALVSDEKKRRRSDRYDSSESSDSGVASLICSDASSWSSSSDITEPVSPASPASSQPSPMGQPVLDNINSSHHFVTINSARIKERKSCPNQKCLISGVQQKQLLAGSTSLSTLSPSFPCNTSLMRRRRYSDSASPEIFHHPNLDGFCARGRGKRIRRLSGEPISNHNNDSFQNYWGPSENHNGTVHGVASNLEWLALIWKNNGCNVVCPDTKQTRKQPLSSNQRQSWPLAKHLHQKSGQLKITEFFSTQVKQHWNYSRFSSVDNKGVKLPVGLCNSNWRLSGSRVAIVSVAQVNRHSDEGSFNPHTPNDSVGFEKPMPASRPLDFGFPAKTSGPAPIRFPIHQVPSCHKSDASLPIGVGVVQCQWQHCKFRLTPGQSLLEHIQNIHVVSHASRPVSLSKWGDSDAAAETTAGATSCDELYSCQWEGCKVQGRPSSSRAWLERHVLLHGGHKPFRCIVDLCEQRFNSQAALQRHVNAHFNQEPGQTGNGNGIKRDNAPAKVIRRNSKKLKHRRSKVAPARLFDFFDSGVMERLRHQLINSRTTHNQIGVSCVTNDLTVHSQVIARRLDANGKSRVLLRWTPQDVLPDQWVLEEEVVTQKNVSMGNLSAAVQIKLHNLLVRPPAGKAAAKQRRKR
ncbi:putative Zinc finger protein AEBP2 [Daphnia magna]|uniref:Uncharacterized protein n=2 Tax=Daphnia magna TaxID=35525 RepID=A0ABQ9ZH50_9CRUS|nr:hypothetical protein OUZ56_021359 [Daphnia magna]KZS04605.1 putative Zinc finger protein AEBP2 [Daphnia magna]